MDDPRRQKFLNYIRKLADLYGLRDWTFEIGNDEPADPNGIASVFCAPGRKHAYIRLTQTFLEDSKEKQRHTLLHEITHWHTASLHHTANILIDPEKHSVFLMHLEYLVDGITSGIAHNFPLPE